jgi:hypothetical protein
MTHNNSKLRKSSECNGTKDKLCGMDPDDERCKSGPIKLLNISRTLCHPYLATLVGITLCKIIMSQNGTLHPLSTKLLRVSTKNIDPRVSKIIGILVNPNGSLNPHDFTLPIP